MRTHCSIVSNNDVNAPTVGNVEALEATKVANFCRSDHLKSAAMIGARQSGGGR